MNVDHEVSLLVEEIKRLGSPSKLYLCFWICELDNPAMHLGNSQIALHL
jgi:hypothetical protein